MQYREFGKTGINVSLLGFGSMRLPVIRGDTTGTVDRDLAVAMIHRAFEGGVNYIDTAPKYCNDQSETTVGTALKGWRDKVYLSTKANVDEKGGGYRRSLERSLKVLDVQYVDFHHLWALNWKTYESNVLGKEGALHAALQAREEGLIRHISFSFHDAPPAMIRIIDSGGFESVLCQYNMLDRANEGAIAHARARGLGVAIMGPVGGGRLGEPSPAIRSMLPGKTASSAELALRFVMASRNISMALSGMSTMQQVEENLAVASDTRQLDAEEIGRINEAVRQNKRLAELYCTGCGYCMPCPHDVNIPLNFELMNYHKVYGLSEYAKSQYAQIGRYAWMKGKKAGDCIECGECEPKCPQKIEIRRQLKETAAALG